MASPSIRDVFVKCIKCETVNRLIAAGLSDGQNVNCSHCGAAMGTWGRIKLMMSSYEAGARRCRAGSGELGAP